MGGILSKPLKKDPNGYATPFHPEASTSTPKLPDKVKTYDYVVIGGGSAGCVLASRLSEDKEVTVLLLEAGQNHKDHFMTQPPLAWNALLHSAVDWDYESTPQDILNGRKIHLPRGKVLGGTGSINATIYHWCSPEDFEEWEREGATGWSYESLIPYFKKSARRVGGTSEETGAGNGPWLSAPVTDDPIYPDVVAACKSVGIAEVKDFNTPVGTLGVGSFLSSQDASGRRSSTATAFLTPSVLARPNLTVAMNAVVERILFDESSPPRAVGVQLSQGPSAPKFVVACSREIVLSAGTYATPQILMVSGIGPKSVLERCNIPVIADLPAVGQNVYDHQSPGPLLFRAKPELTWDGILHSPVGGLLALLRWYFTGKGPFSSIAGSLAAFVRSDDPKLAPLMGTDKTPIKDMSSGLISPDIELMFFPFYIPPPGQKKPPGVCAMTTGGIVLKPTSAGSVTLRTDSVWDKPEIDVNYFDDENDLKLAVAITRLLLRIARKSPLKEKLLLHDHKAADRQSIFWPGDADPDLVTNDELISYIKEKAQGAFHPTSSCRMGKDPSNSVVNPALKLHGGIEGLRIVDASVFPKQVSGHPAAVVVSVAERAADMIKNARREA